MYNFASEYSIMRHYLIVFTKQKRRQPHRISPALTALQFLSFLLLYHSDPNSPCSSSQGLKKRKKRHTKAAIVVCFTNWLAVHGCAPHAISASWGLPQSPILSHVHVKPRDDKSSLLKINGYAVSLLFSAPTLHQY